MLNCLFYTKAKDRKLFILLTHIENKYLVSEDSFKDTFQESNLREDRMLNSSFIKIVSECEDLDTITSLREVLCYWTNEIVRIPTHHWMQFLKCQARRMCSNGDGR
ncbi:hypothetical protein NPIL_371061 [Nephila pilipes]|uniref:Uncharacterized protein n=1 Tax=Nephila pilipes TaxID=299642 RepID=A0A8X6NJ04_NEPPI|nr:hypothetical protein NPIL_371061 [Nephila pilipes]